MNISQLNYFVTLVEYKHYGKAAKKLYISQPALSKAIKNLEEELDVTLFTKVGKENQLTKYGKIFHKYVKSSLNILDAGTKQIKSLTEDNKRNIRLETVSSCATQCVPLSIFEFKKRFPNVHFQYKENVSKKIIEHLLNSEIDLGLISDCSGLTNEKNIEVLKLFDYEAVLAVPKNHRFKKKTRISYKDILEEPFVSYTEDTANLKVLKSELDSYNLPYPKNITVRCNTESAVIASIEKGLGIGLVSDTSFNKNANLHFLKFDNIVIKFPIYIVWRNDLLTSRAIIAYKDYILNAHHIAKILK
ncbi:HTH-type transcriptional regulator GltC [Fusobacterium sp. DD29]|uniref:LysR family transcriptional regulator n=1 Tax=unclassified Fusobacterium TaxID=2648384 RepID=UPI001B8B7E46|nr:MULTISPECIES: LysR family transcriptional regulator [unclassified Fusobacterium]MBR8701963.1 HTH-type transcriptional regulator GltC [Fusobacterium sp. DD45]MBR8711772.1 HTH-type transcriptional regulator GltC [Fusobacterium sp. DD28]MBR8749672.1 HTH-type transcriptional regulator GltC [Fusobacterium sp. DD29]MBR8752334.1 HTH-type transcriptional regulator GltC [Fusobacterium sp. DD26]MBR8761933.1 HTH-type transcriptional regulator GltC [Fusobacterium sp. DD25]